MLLASALFFRSGHSTVFMTINGAINIVFDLGLLFSKLQYIFLDL